LQIHRLGEIQCVDSSSELLDFHARGAGVEVLFAGAGQHHRV
jgi:hypothetical protein